MYGDFPAKNTVYTPYIPINVWFWPTYVYAGRSSECASVRGLPYVQLAAILLWVKAKGVNTQVSWVTPTCVGLAETVYIHRI
jgi:hypothetical protein